MRNSVAARTPIEVAEVERGRARVGVLVETVTAQVDLDPAGLVLDDHEHRLSEAPPGHDAAGDHDRASARLEGGGIVAGVVRLQRPGRVGAPEVVRVRGAKSARLPELGSPGRGQIVFAHGDSGFAGSAPEQTVRQLPSKEPGFNRAARVCSPRGIGIGLETEVITRIGRPYWIAARLLLLGLAALFVATAISSVVRGRLSRADLQGESQARIATDETSVDPLSAYLPIARRNLFAAVPQGDIAMPGHAAEAGPTGGVRLLGTGGTGDARYAIVESTTDRKQQLVGLGEALDGAQVVDIGWRRVTLDRGGTEEILAVPADLGTRGGQPTPRPGSIPVAAAHAAANVRKIGDDRFLIGRAEVDHQLEQLSDLFTQMRAVPNMKDGRTEGFRVFAIRRGSLFEQLGLLNNDVVQRINGVELTDPTRAMGLFEELKGETRLSVDVLRGGEPRTLSYEIR